MSSKDQETPDRLRFLAGYIAGRALAMAEAAEGEPSHTDGLTVFVSRGAALQQQRQEVLVQSALLAAGSLDTLWVKAVRGRPQLARRYLSLEGYRALVQWTQQVPTVAGLLPSSLPLAHNTEHALQLAKSRMPLADPPSWFGVIRPSRLLQANSDNNHGASRATNNDLQLAFQEIDIPEADNDGDEEQSPPSKILRLFENPLFNNQALSDYFRKLVGGKRVTSEENAGAEVATRALRRSSSKSSRARPIATRILPLDQPPTQTELGVGIRLHPEWDEYKQCYKPDWCRVVNFPMTHSVSINRVTVQPDPILYNRLARLGLGPKLLRRQPDGEDLDMAALTDYQVDIQAGYSPPERIYLERRKLARDLGVLILVDASGSATETDRDGLAVHEHQRQAAVSLARTLEDLGDRVAVYGFRSHGRANVQLLALKPFAQRFGAGACARLQQLEPSGYTRLGAGIRGAGEILKRESGTPQRLLLVLSDGFPYDDGYEHRYAEADARKALEELRQDGVACLGLSIGAGISDDALHNVFGSTCHAAAATLNQLSPRMDALFLSALKELSAPKPGTQSSA